MNEINIRVGELDKLNKFIADVGSNRRPILICGEQGVGKRHTARRIMGAWKIPRDAQFRIDCSAYSDEEIRKIFVDTRRFPCVGVIVESLDSASIWAQSFLTELLEHRTDDQLIVNFVFLAGSSNLSELRQDLWYSLSSSILEIPPLYKRQADIVSLARKTISDSQVGITNDALEVLCNYNWSGNLDEFFSVLERAILTANGKDVDVGHLGIQGESKTIRRKSHQCSLKDMMDKYEKTIVEEALAETKGNKTKAAILLDISERIIGLRCKNLNIDPRDFRKFP